MIIKYFSWIKEHVGKSEEQIELPDHINNVDELINHLNELDKKYSLILEKKNLIKIAVNKTYPKNKYPKPGPTVKFFIFN